MRRFRSLIVLLLLVAFLAGHYFWWYAPRERAGSPDPAGLPARLLASGAYDACFWAPYPHQNLGKLRGAIEDGTAWVAALARVSDLPAPVLPSFGPFTLPPSSEIAGCSDLDGKRFLVVARVYPAIAAIARAAGAVAKNPWLAGGEVQDIRGDAEGIDERVVRVAWREGLWTVGTGEAPALDPAGGPEPRSYPEGLGIFRLRRGVSEFPAGDYLLRRMGQGQLELALEQPGSDRQVPVPDLPRKSEPVLLAVAGPSWPAAEAHPLPPAAFALFDIDEQSRGTRISSLGGLPGAAVFHPPGEQRWELPTQGLAGLVTGTLPKGNAGGWKIVAVDRASLRRAKALAPHLSALTSPDASGSLGSDGRLVLGLWAQPRPALRVVAEVRKVLEGFPLVPREQVRRWKDWETLLRPVAACERVSLTSTQAPPSFRLLFNGCTGRGR